MLPRTFPKKCTSISLTFRYSVHSCLPIAVLSKLKEASGTCVAGNQAGGIVTDGLPSWKEAGGALGGLHPCVGVEVRSTRSIPGEPTERQILRQAFVREMSVTLGTKEFEQRCSTRGSHSNGPGYRLCN